MHQHSHSCGAGEIAPRELLQIVTITLPERSRYLDSILQLETRIQLGLAANELFGLLQAHGFSPRWLSTPGVERCGVVTLSVEVPEHAPQLLTCRTARISLH